MTEPNESRSRDAATLRVLSIFFLVLGTLILFATLWTLEDRRAMIVNMLSGATILSVGIFMRFASQRIAVGEDS